MAILVDFEPQISLKLFSRQKDVPPQMTAGETDYFCRRVGLRLILGGKSHGSCLLLPVMPF